MVGEQGDGGMDLRVRYSTKDGAALIFNSFDERRKSRVDVELELQVEVVFSASPNSESTKQQQSAV
jgi:hypothetical protein